MRYLRITLWGIGLIIVLELLKKLLDNALPVSIVFHHNLLASLQAVLLFWTFCALLLCLLMRKRTLKKIALVAGSICAGVIAIGEITCSYWLHHPGSIPAKALSACIFYYHNVQRNVVQYNPAYAEYDSSLFYRLRPSSAFLFTNYEFADTFHVNSKGLRDDEMSLNKPEVIVVGDSYAMGWSVQQSETFAQQLEKISGKKVLNAGMSSYAQARELKSLYSLDTTNLRYIVIQYCRNDEYENDEFVKNNFKLDITPEKVYDSLTAIHYWSKTYFPGKHFLTISKLGVYMKLASLKKAPAVVDSSAQTLRRAAHNFLDILTHSKINFAKTKVLMFDMNEKSILDNRFIDLVKELATNDSSYSRHLQQHFSVMPVADILTNEDFNILDFDHIKPSGHRKIAERLRQYLFTE